ncbi:glycosyltransferase family 2 protein [Idiomarina loihiensis]|uniref:Glycosyltransferase n=1 Tax=Idiomarina loihiensis (strain ATCC BAA-735 / DSM 15497 / L2-TR) TaxID=283942 RepID=Q5QWU6_IDILO|nr:glycosyltransferase family 2 protein [Idiomarina loihiensis]AAV81398.1 Glycosyltransferase [Idiomarina loihiensis L2TR]AGM35425.1 glycosyltransferase [Idiomarina loihiensis GSL 199]
MSLVSVIIPVKDRVLPLKRAIESVKKQSHRNIEVIIVENNSKSPPKIKAAIEDMGDPALKFFSLSSCDNANVARNYGISKASGDYLAILDSDDEFFPTHIEDCLKLLTESCCDFVFGSIYLDDGASKIARYSRNLTFGESGIEYLFGKNAGWAPTPTYFLRKEVTTNVVWDENLRRHQDFDFFIRVVSKYRVIAKKEPSVVVHWKKGEKRTYDSSSMRIFYDKWRSKMGLIEKISYSKNKVRIAILNRDMHNLAFFTLEYFKAKICAYFK